MHNTRFDRSRGLALAATFLFSLPLIATSAHAEGPIDPKSLPDALKPWVSWVLHDKENKACPTVFGGEDEEPRCQWPSRLELRLDDKGGTFQAEWHVHARGWYPLPGDESRWPQDVTLGRARVAVVEHNEVPAVFLQAGDHKVSGRFQWDTLPESLRVPPETGLLTLVVKGQTIDRPNRQADGVVFLQKEETASEGERLELVVHRKIIDEVPLQLVTRIVLNIAGKKREVLLGRSLPEGFLPLAMESQLPARIEPDSRLRVQVRPGTWTIQVTARSQGPVAALRRPQPGGPWRDGDEVWVFEARNSLRLCTVEGVNAIDPAQTSLPDDWKRLPAYPMRLTDTLRLVEKRRGDAEPTPERLQLRRLLWLDFNGGGFTVSDSIAGALQRATRLEMTRPTRLGRVSVSGHDQFITHLGDLRQSGIELRPGQLAISADSRIESGSSEVPAIGWNRDFHQVSGRLHLPPGWRLLHASGVDEVGGTWVRHWTLLEIFLVLVLSIAAARLFGILWGLLALTTFVLIFPEGGAPKWIWAFVLALEALVRALPKGRLHKVLTWARHGVAVLLALITLPFLVGQVRYGLYPALEIESADDDISSIFLLAKSAPEGRGGISGRVADESYAEQNLNWLTPAAPAGAPAPSQEKHKASEEDADTTVQQAQAQERADGRRVANKAGKVLEKPRSKSSPIPKSPPAKASGSYLYNVESYDSKAMIQTGPGRPRWTWRSFDLHWSGPVQRSQMLHLYLTSPATNLVLAFLRAALLILLVLCALPWKLLPGRLRGGAAAAVTLLALLWLPASAHAQQVPSKEILDELATRLLAKPSCTPSCASIPRMLLEADGATLRLRLEIGATAATALPIPGSASQWTPQRVLLDGKPAAGLARNSEGVLQLLITPGAHQAILEGSLAGRDSVQLSLPVKPHRVEAALRGWTVEGLHEDGVADDDLQLTRVGGGDRKEKALQPGVLPPFVRVERMLLIGLNWQVQTRVLRLSPPGVAVVLEVPLLAGESVTTADVRVVGGKALLNMGPQATETSWTSVLAQRSPITLVAPAAVSWVESWRLDVHPIWHATTSGIPAIHPEDTGNPPEWHPWPSERLQIALTRPEGIAGQTVTIDESQLALDPGVRATDAQLDLTIRSSRGAEHNLGLPEGAMLESVTVNGSAQPIRQVGRRVTLALVPGTQRVVLRWREPSGERPLFRAQPADLGTPSVNVTTQIKMSDARWILLVGGPRMGPVVLFWSLLLVLLVAALVLGRINWVPLRSRHWMLLAIGLSQVHVVVAALVVGWILLLGRRARATASGRRLWFNTRQILIVLWTLTALGILLAAIHEGLLGHPDMQIHGNGSSASQLSWFQDRAEATPAAPWVLSVPLYIYRLAMLAWALWLAFAVLRWLRWGWRSWTDGGWWRPGPPKPPKAAKAAPTGASAPAAPTAPAAPVEPATPTSPPPTGT